MFLQTPLRERLRIWDASTVVEVLMNNIYLWSVSRTRSISVVHCAFIRYMMYMLDFHFCTPYIFSMDLDFP